MCPHLCLITLQISHNSGWGFFRAVVGLMDRALDLKPEVTQGWKSTQGRGCPRLLPGRCTDGCPLLQVCTLGWVKCREHISLCIIVYVTNKALPSLICIVCTNQLIVGKNVLGSIFSVLTSILLHYKSIDYAPSMFLY